MIPDFDFLTMSSATAAVIAQIMPVFLVALIAERVVFKRSANERTSGTQIVAVIARVLIDVIIALGLLVVTGRAVIAVEVGGLEGPVAERMWVFAGFLVFVVLYRWVLLSTPLVPLISIVISSLATLIAKCAVALVKRIAAVVQSFGVTTRRLPEEVFDFISGAYNGAVTVLGSVVTAGLSDGISAFTSRIAEAFGPDAHPDDDDDGSAGAAGSRKPGDGYDKQPTTALSHPTTAPSKGK